MVLAISNEASLNGVCPDSALCFVQLLQTHCKQIRSAKVVS
jgi:hypothetical protein